MMKKTEKRKLLLDRQSVRVLKASALRHVQGAATVPGDGTSVQSALVCTNVNCSSQRCIDVFKTYFGVC